MTTQRLCLDCKHCYLYGGHGGYSEYTPAEGTSFGCSKGYWDMSGFDIGSKESVKSNLLQAETCKDYEKETP